MAAVLKKTFLGLCIALLSLLILTVGLMTWVIAAPLSAWHVAERYFLPEDLKITWAAMDGGVHVRDLRHWGLKWSVKDLTIVKTSPQVDAGLAEALVKVDFNFLSSRPLMEFEVLKIHARDVNVVYLEESQEPPAERSLYEQMKEFLDALTALKRSRRVDVLDVQIPRLELHLPKEAAPLVIGASVTKANGNPQALSLVGSVELDKFKAHLSALIDPAFLKTPQDFLVTRLHAELPGWNFSTDLNASYDGRTLKLAAAPRLASTDPENKLTITPKFSAILQEDAANIKMSEALMVNIPGPVTRFDRVDANIMLPFSSGEAWSEKPATVHLWSDVDLFMIDKNMRPPLEKACQCRLPEKFRVTVDGSAWLRTYFNDSTKKKKVAALSVKVDGVKNKLFTAEIAAHSDVYRQNNKWLLDPSLDSEMTVHSFQGLRRFLDAKGVLIPAPLDVLEGKIFFSARAPVTEDEKQFQTVADLNISLASSLQKVDIETKLRATLSKDFKAANLHVSTLIKALKLELPPIDPVRGIPHLASDSRILYKKAPAKKKPSNFLFTVTADVLTEKPGAVQLLTKYAEPHVPITMDLKSEGASMSGFARLEPFAMTYLRRRLVVEKIAVTMKGPDPAKAPLSGRMHIDQGGYRIFIDLSGTLEAPSYVMSSDPYLPKKDIISVLLYGRVSDQLVSGESESAGSFNAALADRAIGLFGLWAFASTPVQSFSYDATRKVYTATVKLSDGLTAGIGTNWERATNFELRQRLTRRWVITASWMPNEDGTGQESRLVLRWEYRF